MSHTSGTEDEKYRINNLTTLQIDKNTDYYRFRIIGRGGCKGEM